MKKTKILCLAAALAFAPSAFAVYKCVDEKGITRIGETPPDECSNVPMQEVSRSGTVLRTIAPSLTPAQVEANRAAEEKRKVENKAAAEQARKDEALLNTYASDREIDMTRDRNIEPINARIRIAKERIVAIDKRMQQIQDEMEFYKAGKGKSGKTRETPEALVHDLDRAKKEKATIEKSLTDYDKEIAALKAKYETDRQRWTALKQAKKTN